MSESGVGDKFQRATKYFRGRLPRGRPDWSSKPEGYLNFPSAPRVVLSPPSEEDGPPLWTAIRERRSIRRYQHATITPRELSQLLWAAQGLTARRPNVALRAAPSAGALYPIETYLSLHNVEGIDPGIYHYDVRNHELAQLRDGDYRAETAAVALDQRFVATANIVFVWTAVFPRSKWKYQQRAYRYAYLDAGHIAQNVALAAVALGLGSCQIAALFDDEANALLGVDGEDESVIYMTTIGRPE